MVKAEDLGAYFRIPADTRDLNYGKYFSEGASGLSSIGEYNSDNTHQLNLEDTKRLFTVSHAPLKFVPRHSCSFVLVSVSSRPKGFSISSRGGLTTSTICWQTWGVVAGCVVFLADFRRKKSRFSQIND
jgi:hypothetical protein